MIRRWLSAELKEEVGVVQIELKAKRSDGAPWGSGTRFCWSAVAELHQGRRFVVTKIAMGIVMGELGYGGFAMMRGDPASARGM